MTLPIDEPYLPSATRREQEWFDSPKRRLLKGTCSLVFEGQCFIPDGGQREYWLDIEHETRKRLIGLLTPLGYKSQLEVFHIEFWGTLSWVGGGCGHFGMFGGTARIDEIVSVAFSRPEPEVQTKARSIRERLRMGGLVGRQK